MEQNKNTYYAFYSNIAVEHNMLLASNSISGRDNVIYNIYTLADGTNRCIKCTAVYECEKYSNPDDVLKKITNFLMLNSSVLLINGGNLFIIRESF